MISVDVSAAFSAIEPISCYLNVTIHNPTRGPETKGG